MSLESYFTNPSGLFFLAFLAPLILLYLIKPKPMRKKIPSLMFILKDIGKNPINRLFKNFVSDILLLIQFLAVLCITLSVAQPYIMVPQKLLVHNTILLVDVSASTRIGDRFDEIISKAIDNLADKNTIILIKDSPDVLIEDASASKAKHLLKKLQPTDTTTNIVSALKLATQYAGPETNVIIISDFLPSAGSLDVNPQINALKSMGSLVTPILVGKPTPNVGIIDMSVRPDNSKIWIKNYYDTPRDVTLSIGDVDQSLVLGKKETKEITFSTPTGVTKISIKEKDDFMSDNTVYISTPSDNDVDVLILTNDKDSFEKSNFKLALDIIDKNFPVNFNIKYAIPPKVPDLTADLYIFYKIKPDFILPGVIKELESKINDGAGLIITAQNDLFALDFRSLLGVDFKEMGTNAEIIPDDDNVLTKDINFGQVKKYFQVTAKKGVTVISKASDSPIFTLHKIGKGMIFYYGIFDGQETFSSDNTYPIFLRRVIDLLTNRPSLRSLNLKTGTLLSFNKEEKIKTPIGKLTTNSLQADVAGLYILNDRTIAVNTLSDLESNSMREPLIKINNDNELSEKITKKGPKDITNYLLLAGIILLFLELLYVKFRGDL